MTRLIMVPIAAGELIDKITILEIKAERIHDPVRLANIESETALLRSVAGEASVDNAAIANELDELTAINAAIWQDEEIIRALGATNEFGEDFAQAARRIYENNDRRYRVKRRINELCGSAIVEEKSY